MENGCMSLFSKHSRGGFSSWLRSPWAARGSTHNRARTGGPPGRAPRLRGRAQGEGCWGQGAKSGVELTGAGFWRTLHLVLFRFLEVFANQQSKFCSVQKRMRAKFLYGCFKERKQ